MALLAGPVLARSAAGVPQFASAKSVLSFPGDVGGLSEVAVGDLDGDGTTDLVVTRLTFPPAHVTFPVGILLGDGRGGFKDGSSMWQGPPARTEHARQILIADLNGDGRNDIFIADHGYDAEPFPGHPNTLILSTSDGKLVDASATMPPESGFSHSAAVADVNGDGARDIYVGNLCCGDGTPPEILLNDGTGHFTRRTDLLPDQVEQTARGVFTRSIFLDANHDGAPDLILGGFTGTESLVLLNDGTGHFHVASTLPPKPFGAGAILISFSPIDVNADGLTDLLAGFQRQDFSGRQIEVLVNQGDGTFRDETSTRLPDQDSGTGWPYAIPVGDLNGDGAPDFGVNVYQAAETAPLYLNDGHGVFHQAPSPALRSPFEFVDTNGDGRLDVVSSQPAGGGGEETHYVQLQLGPPGVVNGLRASRAVRDGVHLSWRSVAVATSYEVWRGTRGRPRSRIAIVHAAGYVDRRARPGVDYIYAVRAANALGIGPFSAVATGRRKA